MVVLKLKKEVIKMKIFLTGATGFLGGELLMMLSKIPEAEVIHCLVRAHDEIELTSKLQSTFDFHGDFWDKTKIVPILGDLTDEWLSRKLKNNDLLSEVDTVIHSGACTSFLPQRRSLVKLTNILGSIQIADWASQLKKLKTFVYVGTAMIVGCEGCFVGKTIKEDFSPSIFSKHIVEYTFSKMIGESMVRDRIPSKKLLVVRPSAIFGDSRPWNPRSNDIIWAFSTLNAMRLFPVGVYSRCDLIPVDFAVKAIMELLFVNRKHTVYHISAFHSASSTENILRAYADVDCEKPKPQFVDRNAYDDMRRWSRTGNINGLGKYAEYISYWDKFFGGNGNFRIILAGIRKYLDLIDLDQIFDNNRLLRETGIGASEPAHVYLKRMYRHIRDIDVVDGARNP